MPSKKLQKEFPSGSHNAYIKSSRIIKRMEEGVEVIRIETTYHVENFGDLTHYSVSINYEEGLSDALL